jgi:hypothetical protein
MSGFEQAKSARNGDGQHHVAAATNPQLTVAQMDRLIKAMGSKGFRSWFEDFRHGKAKETVEQLMNVLDTIGEDVFRQYYDVESAPRASNNGPSGGLAHRLPGVGASDNCTPFAIQLVTSTMLATHSFLQTRWSCPLRPTTRAMSAGLGCASRLLPAV